MSRRIADYRKPFFGFKDKFIVDLAYKFYFRPNRQDLPVQSECCNYELTILSAISVAFCDRINYLQRCQDFEKKSILHLKY